MSERALSRKIDGLQVQLDLAYANIAKLATLVAVNRQFIMKLGYGDAALGVSEFPLGATISHITRLSRDGSFVHMASVPASYLPSPSIDAMYRHVMNASTMRDVV